MHTVTVSPGKSPESNNERSSRKRKNSKETIHSGHFMVSDFEAEDQDEEGLEVPEPLTNVQGIEEIKGVRGINQGGVITYAKPTNSLIDGTTVSIDASLTKLFKTMTLAYRQKITSPKWNCFKGLRLRWKDKIRLNNVIWRCWHMQYRQRKRMTVCQFTLDVDIHNRPEAIVLEGKYWKRRTEAITAEYRKWRVYYKNRRAGLEPLQDLCDMLGREAPNIDNSVKTYWGLEEMDWARGFLNHQGVQLEEGDIFQCIDFTDMLFSPFITSPQLFPFPNPREIARGTGNSDLQQPGLVQLQPNLTDDDVMEIQEMLAGKGLGLPTVPEEDPLGESDSSQHPQRDSNRPPSVSTPVPGAPIEYTAHLTAAHLYTSPNTPDSLYFHEEANSSQVLPQESFILPESSTRPQEHLSQHHEFFSIPTTPLPNATTSHQPTTPFSRSRSEQHLSSPSPSATGLHQEDCGSSFAVPKLISRRRSHSGSVPYGSPPLSTFSQPHLAVSTPALYSRNVTEGSRPISDCTFLNRMLIKAEPSSSGHQRNIPTAIHPRIVSNSSRGHHNNTLEPVEGLEILGSETNTVRATIVNGSPAAGHLASLSTGVCQSSLIRPAVTLSAVTPSSMKDILSNSQFSKWSSGIAASSSLKSSPPYQEPTSPQSYCSIPSPPSKSYRSKNDGERTQYKEHRRVCHINAEQKRRCNIKNNFDTLHSLIPSINQNSNGKVSKATMLHKGAEYIVQLRQEKQHLMEQAESLKSQIEVLNSEISTAQSLLPATGAPLAQNRQNKMKEKYDSYVREQTLLNYKYYVLALVADPLMGTYNSSVSTASVDDLCRSSLAWLDQHCSLNILRPIVSNAMRKLSTMTNILSTPEKLPEDIYHIVNKHESNKFLSSFSETSLQR